MKNAKARIIYEHQDTMHMEVDFNCSSYDVIVGTTKYWFGDAYYVAILNLHISARIEHPNEIYQNAKKIRDAARAASIEITDEACHAIAFSMHEIWMSAER